MNGKIIIIVVAAVTIFSTLYEFMIYGGKNHDEITEQEKTMRALRALIYLIMFIIIAGIIIKLFFWSTIATLVKGK